MTIVWLQENVAGMKQKNFPEKTKSSQWKAI